MTRSWNVQNSFLPRFSCSIRSHLQEYSYHPVILSLLRPLSLILLPSLPSSFFFPFFFIPYPSFFIALYVPSVLLPACLHLSFLTSLSFLPVSQPWSFPPSFTVTLTPSRPISLTLRALLFLPSLPIPFVSLGHAPRPHKHLSPFSSPYTSLFRI